MGVLGADTSVPPIPGEAGAVQVAVRLGVTCWNGHKGEKQVWGWGSVGERSGPPLRPPSRMSPSLELTLLRSWQWSKSQGRCREVRTHPFPNTDHLPLVLC